MKHNLKELIHINNIEIQKPNRFKDFLHKICSKFENFLFDIFLKIPEKYIPAFAMSWMEEYTTKRISDLEQQIVRNRWKEVELKEAVDSLQNRQQS